MDTASFVKLYEEFVSGSMEREELEKLKTKYENVGTDNGDSEEWLRVGFLINMKLSEMRLSISDVDGEGFG